MSTIELCHCLTVSFVASSGLESFALHTSLSARDDTLLDFVKESMRSFAASTLPFVAQTWIDPSTAVTNDQIYNATLLNEPAQRASKAQGVAILTVYSKAFMDENPTDIDANIRDIRQSIRSRKMQGHLPICFALVCKAMLLSKERTLHLHLFLQARNVMSAAVRLNRIGPYLAQRLLLRLQPFLQQLLTDYSNETLPAAHQTWPALEIMQARHDKLYSRMFNS